MELSRIALALSVVGVISLLAEIGTVAYSLYVEKGGAPTPEWCFAAVIIATAIGILSFMLAFFVATRKPGRR